MKHKTAIQECIEKSSNLDFMHWFYANRQRLFELEKEQIQNAHLSGQNSADEEDGETEIDYYNNVYGA
jgi:hypothetical protein